MDTSNLSFLSGCGDPHFFHFISFRVWGPSILSGCGDSHFFHFIYVLHFFQGAGTLISFISFISFVFYISFGVQGPSFLSILSILLCFSFLSGCGDPQFFHFICVFHFFQGVGTLISFRVRGSSILSFLSGSSFLSFLYKISLGNISKKGNFQNKK